MHLSAENFKAVKIRAENFYKTFQEVYCPYFKGKIKFNSKGLEHIEFKSWRRPRHLDDQYFRFKFLKLAPQVIRFSHTLQGVCSKQIFERQHINSRWEKRLVSVYYYEFIAILDQIRVRVIIKQIQGGEKYFWSIIPFWKMDETAKLKLMYNGFPEFD